MKTYDLQKAREIELTAFGTTNISKLKERKPQGRLYTLAESQMSVVPTQDFFCLSKIHLYFLDLARTIVNNVEITKNSQTLDSDTRKIFHDLAGGGSQQVGVLNARRVETCDSTITRGFARILFQTDPAGFVQEGYILCDLGYSSLVRRRSEVDVSAFEDAPHELMKQPGYLMRDDVFLEKRSSYPLFGNERQFFLKKTQQGFV